MARTNPKRLAVSTLAVLAWLACIALIVLHVFGVIGTTGTITGLVLGGAAMAFTRFPPFRRWW